MVEIRNPKKEEVDEYLQLSEFSFQYVMDAEHRERKVASFDPGEHWGCYVDAKLAAKMALYEKRVFLQGRTLAIGAIASVATWPEYRRGGLVSGLLKHALQTMKERRIALSMLHPFDYGFYRKFGWGHLCDIRKYEFPSVLLRKWQLAHAQIVRIDPLHEWGRLDEIYTKYAVRFNGMLLRPESWWKESVLSGKERYTALLYESESGHSEGYALYTVKDRELRVKEFIHLNESARNGLLSVMGNHDSMADRVLLSQPMDDTLPYLLDNPRIKQEVHPWFMARIVDVVLFMEQYAFAPSDEDSKLCLQLHDTYAPWNDGVFAIWIDRDGRCRVKWVEGNRDELSQFPGLSWPSEPSWPSGSSEPASLQCDISTLSSMMMGYLSPQTLYAIGRLQGNRKAAEILQSRMQGRLPYFIDYY